MANVVSNVVAGRPLASGGLLKGPLGTPLPTSATGALNVAIKPVGYLSDAGVTLSNGRSTDKIKAWGGDVVKVIQSEHTVSIQFEMIETLRNKDAADVAFGAGNVTVVAATSTTGAGLAIKLNADTLEHQEFFCEVKDGAARVRVVIPDGQVTETGDITYSDNAVVVYPVTVECFPDAQGNKAYIYSDDGITTD